MARNRSTTPAASTDTATTPAPEEGTVTTTTTPDASTDTATTPEEKVDTFGAFTTALETALSAATDGDGVSEVIAAPVVTAYRALRGKARDRAAAHVAEIMNAKITEGDLGSLGHIAALQQAYTAPAASTPAEKAPVDPREAFAARITPLIAAVRFITDAAVLDGVDVSTVDTDTAAENVVAALWGHVAAVDAATDENPAPALTGDAAVAAKILTGRGIGRTGSKKGSGSTRAPGAPRRDVPAHVRTVLDAAPDGATLTVADIVREGSAEYAPGEASQGAVSNAVRKLATDGYTVEEGPLRITKK